MVALARKYQRDVTLVRKARDITDRCPERAARAQVQCLQAWVRDHIKYVNDPRLIEMLQTPVETLRIGTGDCDDKATLLATLLETMGFTTRFVAVAEDVPGVQAQYNHVMAQVRLGPSFVNLETILPGVGVGWFPSNISRNPPPLVRHV